MKTTLLAVCILHWTTAVYSDLIRTGADRRLTNLKVPKIAFQRNSPVLKRVFKGLKQIKNVKQAAGSPVSSPFSPEQDDADWPGVFPVAGSNDELILNIRLDEYPGEVVVTTRTVFPVPPVASVGTSPSKNAVVKPSGNQTDVAGSIWTTPIDSFNEREALYQIEIADESGDGICCGPSGNGWITVTGTNETVLWSAVGNYTYVVTVYLWKDNKGEISIVYPQESDSVPPPTAPPIPSVVPPTAAPTQVGNCSLCPIGSSPTPTKQYTLGSSGVVFNCADMEDYFLTFTIDQCADTEAGGDMEEFASYFRALCECPGYGPGCACNGNQMSDLNSVIPDSEYTCFDYDEALMKETDCSEWSSSGIDLVEDFCGCPTGQFECPFDNPWDVEAEPEDDRAIELTVYTDRSETTCLSGLSCDPWSTSEDEQGTLYFLYGQEIVEIGLGCPGYEAVQRRGDQVCISYYVS
ncbi:expressed unknown protein [Seminavis robusta]|uniref:Uncharacterized protein n=1 Tax=Seminavis robusta TaxID=568900 RepID=A0A9N8ECG1_9STRA|nr:expressed unknown protein [Seminavis robusta]|eukprot:Sro944_g223000.1 n/a (465) ;mRNA; r:34012-35489